MNIYINGKVQGVGFRYFVKNVASKYGIAGYVKNERDGSVYISADGESENLDLFVEACRKGPIRAVIIKFTVVESPSVEGYPISFIIR